MDFKKVLQNKLINYQLKIDFKRTKIQNRYKNKT